MDILFDLHTHTTASGHAFSTLKENIEEAKKKGLLAIGTSDHGMAMPGSADPVYFTQLKILNDSIMGVKILRGIESNIIDYHGHLDVKDSLLAKMDYIIASLHTPCITPGSVEQNTKAIIGAMKNPLVKIIGHPDDDRYPLDYEKVVAAAKEFQVVLELNNSSFQPTSGRVNALKNAEVMLNLCKRYEVRVIMSSDAHIYYNVGTMTDCEKIVQRLDFPEELVLNYSLEKLKYVLGVC
ncbi:phosphatase [Desulfosporosinus sp. FKA]|uniref:phosphatase n=1 Tax=Desulfosporosinus sp. FKA TaxID=1969834 RepID=UPI000B4998C2|nr:phosphatase [Desulfosporosinus sp. FKA]